MSMDAAKRENAELEAANLKLRNQVLTILVKGSRHEFRR